MSGVTLRPVLADELEALAALHRRSEAFDGVPRVVTSDDLAQELDGIRTVMATDARVALVDGEVAGYAYTTHLPSDEGEERCLVAGQVDPDRHGRGVGRALLTWATDRGAEQLRSTGRLLPRYLRVAVYERQAAAHHLCTALGLTPVRWFEELLRPVDTLPPVPGAEGVRLVRWPAPDADRDDELRAVRNAAFADHWGAAPMGPDRWHQISRGHGARPDLGGVAVDASTGEAVGLCLVHRYESDDALLGRRDAWIDTLATLRSWRGRGVASALVMTALHAFAAADLTHASIGVDADSPTGAARLYRSLGFDVVQRSVTYQRQV